MSIYLFFQLFDFNTFSHFFDNKIRIVRFKLSIFTKQIKTNMKKTVLFLATALTLVFASCKKDDKTTSITLPSPELGRATIKGLVKADLTFSTTNNVDEVVAGQRVIVTIDTKDWYLTTPSNSPKKRYETTTGTDGKFEISIEVGDKPLSDVKVLVSDFLAPQAQPSPNGDKSFKWSKPAVSADGIQKGDIKILDPIIMSGAEYK